MNTASTTLRYPVSLLDAFVTALATRKSPREQSAARKAILQLAKHQMHSMKSAHGATVYCESGTAWITQDGVPRDVVLVPGHTYVIDGQARVIVSALEPSRVAIDWSGTA